MSAPGSLGSQEGSTSSHEHMVFGVGGVTGLPGDVLGLSCHIFPTVQALI